MNTGLLVGLIIGAFLFILLMVGLGILLARATYTVTGTTGTSGVTGLTGVTGLQCWNESISNTVNGITDVFRVRAYNNRLLFNLTTNDSTAVSFRIYYSTSPIVVNVFPSTFIQVPISNSSFNAYMLTGLTDNTVYYLTVTKIPYAGANNQTYLTGGFFQAVITTNDIQDSSICATFFSTLNVFSG
jgi:hypothetical protein